LFRPYFAIRSEKKQFLHIKIAGGSQTFQEGFVEVRKYPDAAEK
jgi:hypothetical protein